MSEERRFESLAVEDWRQFGAVDISFDEHLTVLTGANASGKSTILSLLAKHFDWQRNFFAAPAKTKKGTRWTVFELRPPGDSRPVGTLRYNDGHSTSIQAPQQDFAQGEQYQVSFDARLDVSGVFLTSHRAVSGNYVRVESIPALFGDTEQIFQQFTGLMQTRWQGAWGGKTPQLSLKESLIAAAVFGEGSNSVERNPVAWDVWTGFRALLGDIFPSTLGYRGLRIREAEVVVETSGSDFILDEVSGGLSALIEMAWQIFLRSRNRNNFTVLIDEPENHLHPSLQREVMPTLLKAFPAVQFIIATHSPFVVTASPRSAVYVLDYDDDHRVFSRRLDYANKAASADETLRRVLGLDSTMPIWAESRFEEILAEFLPGGLTPDRVEELRARLQADGLAAEFPVALMAAAEANEEGTAG